MFIVLLLYAVRVTEGESINIAYMSKISIRFYNDCEVRAVWDEDMSKWWFSVLDIVGVLNDQGDYQENRNYWKFLKTKLRKEQSLLVSATNQLKLLAAMVRDMQLTLSTTMEFFFSPRVFRIQRRCVL